MGYVEIPFVDEHLDIYLPRGKRVYSKFAKVLYRDGALTDERTFTDRGSLDVGAVYHYFIKRGCKVETDEYYLLVEKKPEKAVFYRITPLEVIAILTGSQDGFKNVDEIVSMINRWSEQYLQLYSNVVRVAETILTCAGAFRRTFMIMEGKEYTEYSLMITDSANVKNVIPLNSKVRTIYYSVERGKLLSSGKKIIFDSYEVYIMPRSRMPPTPSELREFLEIVETLFSRYPEYSKKKMESLMEKAENVKRIVESICDDLIRLRETRENIRKQLIAQMDKLATEIYNTVGRVDDEETGIRISYDRDEGHVSIKLKEYGWVYGYGHSPTIKEATEAINRLKELYEKIKEKTAKLQKS